MAIGRARHESFVHVHEGQLACSGAGLGDVASCERSGDQQAKPQIRCVTLDEVAVALGPPPGSKVSPQAGTQPAR
jgi:hypothetical protein